MNSIKPSKRTNDSRRGAIIIWSTVIMVFLLGMVAFAVDLSYMAVVATQLQNAADAGALSGVIELPNGNDAVITAAQTVGNENRAASADVSISPEDVEFGWFDTTTRSFSSPAVNINAVRVTARVTNKELSFAPIIGHSNFSLSRSAVAILNPRDIAFVVDLSGSMNDDTEPCWATDEIAAKFTPFGFPTVSAEMMQDIYTNFGYGSFPGASAFIFQPLSLNVDPEYAFAEATKDDGPLTLATVAAPYRILNTDDEETREFKAYS